MDFYVISGKLYKMSENFFRKTLQNTTFCENYLWTKDLKNTDEKHVTNTNILMKTMSK